MVATVLGSIASWYTGGFATSLSGSHILLAGSGRLVIGFGMYVANGNTEFKNITMTYGGVGMNKVVQVSQGGTSAEYSALAMFYLLESALPSDGSKTVTVFTAGSNAVISGACWCLQGLKQQAPEVFATHGLQNVSSISKNITTLTDDAYVTYGTVAKGALSFGLNPPAGTWVDPLFALTQSEGTHALAGFGSAGLASLGYSDGTRNSFVLGGMAFEALPAGGQPVKMVI